MFGNLFIRDKLIELELIFCKWLRKVLRKCFIICVIGSNRKLS